MSDSSKRHPARLGPWMMLALVCGILLATTATSVENAQASTGPRTLAAECGSPRQASVTGLTANGRVLWQTPLPKPSDFGNTPAIVKDGVVYADLSGAVTAVDGTDGHIEWSQPLGTDIYGEWMLGSTLLVDVDQVGPDSQVVGLNPVDGNVEWRYRPGGEGLYGDPVVAGDTGLLVVAKHELSLLGAATGRLEWTQTIAAPAQPVADATTVAVAARGAMHGFAISTGSELWSVSDVDTNAALTLDRGVVVIGSEVSPDPTHIAAYELKSGRAAWSIPLQAGSWLLVATNAGLIAEQQNPVDDGGIDLIDPETGRIIWRSSIGRPAYLATTVVVDGSDLAAIVDRPDDGPSYDIGLELGTGARDAKFRLESKQIPLSLTVLDSHQYGTGIGSGSTESGFVEKLGTTGVDWRTVLPQPAQTSAIALPGGGLAVQSEDLACGTG